MIVDIPITAMKLINKHQNTNQDSPYLFPILSGTKTGEELYIEYQQALRTMNYNLGRLAKMRSGNQGQFIHYAPYLGYPCQIL